MYYIILYSVYAVIKRNVNIDTKNNIIYYYGYSYYLFQARGIVCLGRLHVGFMCNINTKRQNNILIVR